MIFAVAADAERAKREYNGAKLDGQAMQLEVQPLGVTGNGTTTLSSGIRYVLEHLLRLIPCLLLVVLVVNTS